MELKQFSHRELKAINNGNPPVDKLPGFAGGTVGGVNIAGIKLPNSIGNVVLRTRNAVATNGASTTNTSLGNILNFRNESRQHAMSLSSQNGPTQSDSSAAGIHPGFAIGAWLGGGVLEGINRIKSADEHLADAGTSEANINGIAYTQQNTVDAGQIMSEYDKTTAKDFLTNPGRGFASLFGRSKAKREAENAAIYADLQQEAARDTAYGKFLQLDFAKRYGNTEDQVLYAKNGKLAKCSEGKSKYEDLDSNGFTKKLHIIQSEYGTGIGKANAMVEPEEFAVNKETGAFNTYSDGKAHYKNPGDILYAQVDPSTIIFPNKINPESGMRFSDEARMRVSTGAPLEPLEQDLANWKHAKDKGMLKAKCGKLPRHAEGWLGNFIPAALGTLASLDQTINAYKNKPYRPNTYASNPYEMEGLTTLAGLRMNPYPIINQLRDAEYRSNRAVDLAGGLSGSLRTAARLANLNTTQKNIANLLSSVQQQNNAYRANYAQAAINAGQASRQARMAANQWDLDYYSKAHAARNKGIQTGIANMLSQIQQYQANEFKRRLFNETMDLYRADQKLRNEQSQWMRNWYASQSQPIRGIGPNASVYDPTNPNMPTYPGQQQELYLKWLYGGGK